MTDNSIKTAVLVTALAITPMLVQSQSTVGDLLFKSGFEHFVTRVALTREINGENHVGWLDIDTNEWFDMTDYFDANYGADGPDDWVTISSDLGYYVMETERPQVYNGWPGLAWGTFDAEGNPSEPVAVDGAPHTDGFATISAGGTQIAMDIRGDFNRNDIWLVNRIGNVWQRADEVNISSASVGTNFSPQFSPTNNKIIWTSYTDDGMDFDENTTDGTNFNHLLSHTRLDPSARIIRPAYEKTGTLVFEGDFQGEQCYRWNPATPAIDPVIISPEYSNDNSCTALINGRIASFWLERPNSQGEHEVRIMQADGTHQAVLQLGVDFWDFLITGGSRSQ